VKLLEATKKERRNHFSFRHAAFPAGNYLVFFFSQPYSALNTLVAGNNRAIPGGPAVVNAVIVGNFQQAGFLGKGPADFP